MRFCFLTREYLHKGEAYECASRRRIPTKSVPTAREYQPVGVGSAPRALFALGVVQPASDFVRWGTRLVTAAVVVCRVCDTPQVE